MQLTRTNNVQALPILFLIFLCQTLFFIFIDEGNYSFNGLVSAEGMLTLGMWTCVFTLMGFILFSIFNRIGSLHFLAKIILATLLATPTAMAIWSMLYFTFKA